MVEKQLERATFGCGCFWCVEALFRSRKGVVKVISGYAGGSDVTSKLKDIASGKHGDAEVVDMWFDPTVVTYNELLKVFFAVHNPFEIKIGHSLKYRSIILYHNETQKEEAEKEIAFQKELSKTETLTTELKKFTLLHEAKEENQNFYEKNPTNTYCELNIRPKLLKLSKDLP